MVLYGIGIINKQGKLILLRQFSTLAFPQLAYEIQSFSKLITADQQHSFVELECTRYLYIPIDDLFIVVISNIASNIIEDLGVLKLIYSLAIDICGTGITEKKILERSTDLLLSFDDIVNMGCREAISLQQLKCYIEMESTDEASFIKWQRIKENEAIELGKIKQKSIKEKMRKQGKDNSAFVKGVKSVNIIKDVTIAQESVKVEELKINSKLKPVGKKAMSLLK